MKLTSHRDDTFEELIVNIILEFLIHFINSNRSTFEYGPGLLDIAIQFFQNPACISSLYDLSVKAHLHYLGYILM